MSYEVIQGDCIERMAKMEEASVDAVICDPPYGLGFMGKQWDDLPPGREFADEALRVLKPGAHLLAFGGTRTYHRLACAIEDAGFEIRDSLLWLYGSGFPKSLDVSKAIDNAAGAEREVVGPKQYADGTKTRPTARQADPELYGDYAGDQGATAPATPEAAQWEGWGTALKPSHEPIVVARKPLIGTVAANVLEHGTGGINVDGCQIVGPKGDGNWAGSSGARPESVFEGGWGEQRTQQNVNGRWPANVVLSEEAAAELDEQTGELSSGKLRPHHADNGKAAGTLGEFAGAPGRESFGDSGGASRFFYCAKTSRGERNAGLEGFEAVEGHLTTTPTSTIAKGRSGGQRLGDRKYKPAPPANNHPTVKPINLMRWLCRLVTPPGGLILDPFLGSGTTGCAAALEGFDFIGIEREAEYLAIAKARIAFWAQHEGRETADVLKAVKSQAAKRKPEQPELEALAA